MIEQPFPGSTPDSETRESSQSHPSQDTTAPTPAATSKERPGFGAGLGPAVEAPNPARKKRPRRRRKKAAGGTGGTGAAEEAPPAAAPERRSPPEASEGGDTAAGAARKKRRRGSRGGRGRKKPRTRGDGAPEVESIPGEEDDLEPAVEAPSTGKKKRRRSRRKKAAGEPREHDQGEPGEAHEPEPAAATGRKKGRSRKKKVRESAAPAAAPVERDQIILVNAIDREESRVAVVETGRIVDFLMTSESQKTLVNDIYRGKVVNLEPAIGAAFVDFGQGRNGFLHTSDVLAVYGEEGFNLQKLLTTPIDSDEWDDLPESVELAEDDEEEGAPQKRPRRDERRRARQRRPITELLRVADPVVVQVTKDAISDKGPTLTTYISIPGRYLVLMPSMSRTGVSRKIPDEKERRRLKRILASMDIPPDMGVIVRTAGVGKTKADLSRDLEYLLGVWETFGKRLKTGRGPAPLYQESDVATRTLRDLFNERTKEVIVDDPVIHEQLVEFAAKLMPEHAERIRLHDAERPVFHHYGIEQDFERIFARRVDLPSGGSIVFDSTEALVAIDVNSGRTRTDSFNFEEIALKTNLEAVPEIARQIKLRDLGGILVCDFIDMSRPSNMRTVERAFRAELQNDRARSKLGRISQFGLLEMTRQRLGPGTHKKVFQICPRCRGTARIRTVPSRAASILRRLGSALTQKGFSTVEVRAHPEVVEYLKEDLYDYLRALEHRFEREIVLTGVPDQPEDSVLRYLRTDGREVRPGGRRKR